MCLKLQQLKLLMWFCQHRHLPNAKAHSHLVNVVCNAFYPAVPVTGEANQIFSITSQIARHMGVILEGTSITALFDILADSVKSFEGLNYAKLAEVKPQWPIVGRGDVYYGGTTYENTQGMGVHLSAAAGRGKGEHLTGAEGSGSSSEGK